MPTDKMLALTSVQTNIVNVIEAETTAFMKHDIDALCNCWVQEPYLQHTTILPYCGVVQVNGIVGLRNHFLAHFKNNELPDIEAESIVRINWQFVVRENMAWVSFEQLGTELDPASHMSGTQKHTRVLEKISECWKLFSSTGVLSKLDFYDCPKIQVDGSATILQSSKESEEVVAQHSVLKISGGRLSANFPKDRTLLRNALQLAQRQIDEGRAHLPIPLVFGEETGFDSSLCWVAILDMKIVVLLNHSRLISTTIKIAGQIFGLSVMQIRVAEEIAKGKDLTAVSHSLGVSINTIRTHVKRMFDRVGVSSQKALLKQLLSAQAPSVGLYY